MFVRAVLIALALVVPAHASTKIIGGADVVHGDSLRMGEFRIRLLGIDAPEIEQQCRLNGKLWQCGRASREALKALIGEKFVLCVCGDEEYEGSLVCWCLSNDEDGKQIDVGEVMVRQGHAVAWLHSDTYVEAESEARKARRGLWASKFDMPWAWRALRRQ